MSYELRDYQAECINVLDGEGATGRHLVAVATGLGKSVIFSHIKRRGRTLILSHRDELVRQPEKYYIGQPCSFGIEKAEDHSHGEDVVSASVQTLSRDSRLQEYGPDDFHTIIIDECHHAASPSYRKILDHFSGAKQILGFTATPKRGDGVRLTDVFDDIIFSRDLRWGIQNRWLSSIRSMRVRANYNLGDVNKVAGDFNQGMLADAITGTAYLIAAKTYVQECHEKGRHTLIYCVEVDACGYLCSIVRELLPEEERGTVRVLTGETPDNERAGILQAFMSGTVRCIINCMVLTEGTDLPICDAVINMRPTCNISLYQQICGRATRLYEGKEYSLIIDIIPNDERKLRNLCTAPTLFGIDPASLDKDILQKFNEDNDLLELCDEIASNLTDISKMIQVTVEMDEAFIQGRKDILIGDGTDNDITSAAARYRDFVEEDLADGSGIDFGDLYVETLPDDRHRYAIRPSWEGRIYISKPNILGKVTVEFHVNAAQLGYRGQNIFVGEMPVEKAVELVEQYCQTVPEYQWYCWSRKLRRNWEKMSATEKQQSRVKSDYKGMGFEGVEGLSKLDASILIDLMTQMNEKKKEAAAYAPGKRGVGEKAKDLFRDKMETEKKAIEAGKKGFPVFQSRVNSVFSSMDARRRREEKLKEKERQEMIEVLDRGWFDVNVKFSESTAAGNAAMTRKQSGFILSLMEQAARAGYSLDKDILQKISCTREASFLIEILLYLKDSLPKPADGKRVKIHTESLLEEFGKLEIRASGTVRVYCSWEG